MSNRSCHEDTVYRRCFGKPGRRALRRHLPEIKELDPELTVVNAENAAGGFGVTASVLDELLEGGEIDPLTSGNHIWDKREALDLIQDEARLLRPHNYPEKTTRFWLGCCDREQRC
ncbi:MAG: hypothetical protein Ct9H300mP16_15570 [Pseudomonadota bacterium]|nr:MAG: hypothetical protein Ct9H300mP16_15570 [Pseudomonadota bacterium]